MAIRFLHEDYWGRMVFQGHTGATYVDVDGELYTMTSEGEPAFPTHRKTADYWPPRKSVQSAENDSSFTENHK